jgi:hypothetical protein
LRHFALRLEFKLQFAVFDREARRKHTLSGVNSERRAKFPEINAYRNKQVKTHLADGSVQSPNFMAASFAKHTRQS